MTKLGMRALATCLQLLALLLSQFLFFLNAPSSSTTPHAPMDECTTMHQCGCPTEKTARHACCCYAGANHRATTESTSRKTMFERLISPAHCNGQSQSHATLLVKLDCVFAGNSNFMPAGRLGFWPLPSKQTIVGRLTEPPEPPPKLIPLV